MTSTSVGMRCPECAGERTRVRRAAAAASSAAAPYATYALIGLNAIAFLAELMGGGGAGSIGGGGSDLIGDGGLCGNAIADGGICGIDGTAIASDGGEVYRLVTGAFLHAGPLHLLFNMFALYVLGTLIEPAIGTPRFLGIYFAALFAGDFGALLLSDPNEVTVGASGAIFGLMAAAFVIARQRGIDEVASQIGLFVVLNLVFTFSIPGISIGGHIGGLVGGALAALLVAAVERRASGGVSTAIEVAGIGVIAIASVAGALAAAAA
jgi:membrane associated rhomboid family serine protease